MPPSVVRGVRRRFRRLSPCPGQVAYVLLTRAPVAGRRKQASVPAAPRLACVKPVASVHPEPGSNSPLLVIFSDSFVLVGESTRPAFLGSGEASYRFFRIDKRPRLALARSALALLLVYCKLFQCPCRPGAFPESECKVTPTFSLVQIPELPKIRRTRMESDTIRSRTVGYDAVKLFIF